MARKASPAKAPAVVPPATAVVDSTAKSFAEVRDWTLNNPDGVTRDFSYDILKRSYDGIKHSAVDYVRAKLRHPTGSLGRAILHRDVTANHVLLPPGAGDMMTCPDRLWGEMDNAFMKADQHLLAGPTIWFPGPAIQHWAIRQVIAFVQERIVDLYGTAAHVIAHAPNRIAHGADFHIHVLCTARTVTSAGFGTFIRPLLETGCQRKLKGEWDAWWAAHPLP